MNSANYLGSGDDPPARRMEEGRTNAMHLEEPEFGYEVVNHPYDGLMVEEKKGNSQCCPALYMNCTPCRTRVNIVVLVLLIFFSAGATLGGFTRPPPEALHSPSSSEGTIVPSVIQVLGR